MCMGVIIDDDMCEETSPDRKPVYPISVASELLDVNQQTIRAYEDKGLIISARRGTRRFYSKEDLEWMHVVRFLLHDKHICTTGLMRMLGLVPCWEIMDCSPDAKRACPRSKRKSSPCWSMAPRIEEKCYLCPVYLSAATHICDEDELALARSTNHL